MQIKNTLVLEMYNLCFFMKFNVSAYGFGLFIFSLTAIIF